MNQSTIQSINHLLNQWDEEGKKEVMNQELNERINDSIIILKENHFKETKKKEKEGMIRNEQMNESLKEK